MKENTLDMISNEKEYITNPFIELTVNNMFSERCFRQEISFMNSVIDFSIY